MKKIASPLFQDLSEAELDTLAAAGHLRTRQFAKHEVIFHAGSCVREIGIVLFLAVVGFKSGAGFIDTLINGDGPAWMMYGVAITLIPLLLVGVLARHYGKLNYLTLCGLLAGSMTDPPALAFANGMHPTSGASALSYATVYPLVMFLRIISPQLLAILLWAGV